MIGIGIYSLQMTRPLDTAEQVLVFSLVRLCAVFLFVFFFVCMYMAIKEGKQKILAAVN